jgi:hypothetical protein
VVRNIKTPNFMFGFVYGLNVIIFMKILFDRIVKYIDYIEDQKVNKIKIICPPKENNEIETKSWKIVSPQMKEDLK